MKRFITVSLCSLLCLLPYRALHAIDYSGTYKVQIEGEEIGLNLTQEAHGKVTGMMYFEGIAYQVKGQIEGGRINGEMNAFDELLYFSAMLSNNQLRLTLINAEDAQAGFTDASETFLFQRYAHKASPAQKETPASIKPRSQEDKKKGRITINGVSLSEKQIAELEQRYRIKPIPGNYWYDSRSGLYGVMDFPAYGFMLPGHHYGKLGSDVSNGNTGIFVNGRHLPQSEGIVWSQLLGYMIQPGRYWLEANGNAGYEGNPIPTTNLYVAAQSNAYQGSGGEGDNFWSSRFSAGNYDSGNQRGYVSVPGHGPVGYGFD